MSIPQQFSAKNILRGTKRKCYLGIDIDYYFDSCTALLPHDVDCIDQELDDEDNGTRGKGDAYGVAGLPPIQHVVDIGLTKVILPASGVVDRREDYVSGNVTKQL